MYDTNLLPSLYRIYTMNYTTGAMACQVLILSCPRLEASFDSLAKGIYTLVDAGKASARGRRASSFLVIVGSVLRPAQQPTPNS
ncbi:MAG: hypothetical protein PVF77_05020, partial [Anaerolineae bacterium]